MYSSSEEEPSRSRDIENGEKADGSEHAVGEMAVARLVQSASVASLPQPFAMRKGSRPGYLNATTTEPFDSKAAHNKRLYSRGVIKIKEARNMRRHIRDTIIRNTGYTKLHPTLESSSSSESESSEDFNWKRETVDWQTLAHETWWAKESLFGIMPVPEINSLVGWATHHTHDGTVAMTMPETTVEESANEETPTDPPSQDNVTNDQDAISVRTERETRSVPQETNPFLFLPNTPLPPSHLRYLTEKAREYVEDPIQNRDVWESHTFLASSDSSDDEKAFKTKYKPKDWQQWEYDAEDETYRATKELLKKRKRLLTMHVPCPTSKFDPKTKKSSRKRKASSKKSHLYKSLDDSALVALGMVWEEMITASLLPLARQHVARCRRLEHNMAPRSSDVVHTDPFQEWTLPPEQAIWRLAIEGVTAALPSAHALARGSQHLFDRESSVWTSLVNGLGNSEQRKQQAVDDWCHTHDLDPALVSNNMDIYGVFLPRPPTVLPRKPMLTEREREDRSEKLDRKHKKMTAKSKITLVADDDDESSMESNDDVE
jgi:hypothetical protein